MEETKKSFICEKCNFKCNYKSKYELHLKSSIHLTGKRKDRCDKREPYICKICGYESMNEFNYNCHYFNNHSTNEEKEKGFSYYCKSCNFGTYVKKCYELHMNTQKHKTKSLNDKNNIQ
jgi:hypothetical protein